MTVDEILDALEDEREKFFDAIDGLAENHLLEPGVNGNWSIKDIMHHISMWEAELVKLLWQVSKGQTPTTIHFPSLDVDATNATWYENGKSRTLEQVREDFIGVRRQTARQVEAFSDDEVNDPKRYAWQRNLMLWEWIAIDSFSHEAEHTAQILEWRRLRGY